MNDQSSVKIGMVVNNMFISFQAKRNCKTQLQNNIFQREPQSDDTPDPPTHLLVIVGLKLIFEVNSKYNTSDLLFATLNFMFTNDPGMTYVFYSV